MKTKATLGIFSLAFTLFLATDARAQTTPQPKDAAAQISAANGINFDSLNQDILEIVGQNRKTGLRLNSYSRVSQAYATRINAGFARFQADLAPLNRAIGVFVGELNAVKSAGLTPEQAGIAYDQLELERQRLVKIWTPFYAVRVRRLFEYALDGYPFDFVANRISYPTMIYPGIPNFASIFQRHNQVMLRTAAGKPVWGFTFDSDYRNDLIEGLRDWKSPWLSNTSEDWSFRNANHVVLGKWTGWNDGIGEKCSGIDDNLICTFDQLQYTLSGARATMTGIPPHDPLLMVIFLLEANRDESEPLTFDEIFAQAFAPVLKRGCSSELCIQFHVLDVQNVIDQLREKVGNRTIPFDVPAEAQKILSPQMTLDVRSTLPTNLILRLIQAHEHSYPILDRLQD